MHSPAIYVYLGDHQDDLTGDLQETLPVFMQTEHEVAKRKQSLPKRVP